jgi:hypothetical protein
MKKQYIAPNTEIIEIKVNQMLTSSPLGWGDPVDNASGAEAPEIQEVLELFEEQ